MAEGTYEYEVMRAELLGVEKPDYEEFMKRQKEIEAKNVEEHETDVENLKVVEEQSDELKGASGKLDELNNLLSLTQKKINNFKFRCSSVTSYMKTRLGTTLPFSTSVDIVDSENRADKTAPTPKTTPTEEIPNDVIGQVATSCGGQKKSDLTKALDSHVDKLDGLLEKAEFAQISMEHQRKQMQSYLKK
nr:uncharacterized protein LOC111419055 [Onthophagus taurus]